MSKVRLYGATSGYLELKAPAVSPDAEVEIPASFGPYGKVLQVVSTVKTDTFSTSSTSFTDVTGLTAAITPSSNTSKVLVIAYVNGSDNTIGGGTHFRLSGGNSGTFVGDAASNRVQAAFSIDTGAVGSAGIDAGAIVYFDSPATTSPTTYAVQMRVDGGTANVNRSRGDIDNARYARVASSITVIEIGA